MIKPRSISIRLFRKIAVGMVTIMMVLSLGGVPSGFGSQVAHANFDIQIAVEGDSECGFWCRVKEILKAIWGFTKKTVQQAIAYFNENCSMSAPEECQRDHNDECVPDFRCRVPGEPPQGPGPIITP